MQTKKRRSQSAVKAARFLIRLKQLLTVLVIISSVLVVAERYAQSAWTVGPTIGNTVGWNFATPLGITVDPIRDYVYVADTYNSRVLKLDFEGNVLQTWGSGGTTPCVSFVHPFAIAVDPDTGNAYVSDWNTGQVQVFDSTGRCINHGNPAYQAMGLAFGAAPDTTDILYLATGGADRVVMMDTSLRYLGDLAGTYFDFPTCVAQIYEPHGIGPIRTYIAQYGSSPSIAALIGTTLDNPWGGPFSPALSDPKGIAVDSDLILYVSDQNNNLIYLIDSNYGSVIGKWGAIGDKDRNPIKYKSIYLLEPTGMSFDREGNMYVANAGRNQIIKLTHEGAYIRSWDNGGYCEGQFHTPNCVAVNKQGSMVYVLDSVMAQVFTYNSEKYSFSNALNLDIDIPWMGSVQFGGIALGNGGIYISVTSLNKILKTNSNGDTLAQWGIEGSAPGEFDGPTGIALDSSGFVYVADSHNDRIQKFTAEGGFTASFDGDGLSSPRGIAIMNDHIYVADAGNNRIVELDLNGTFIAEYGSGTGGPEALYHPEGVDVDGDGNVYVANTGYSSIVMFNKDGWYFDSIASGLSSPRAVAVDGKGKVYVADTNHNLVKTYQLGAMRPWFTPNPGSYEGSSLQVTISSATTGAVIRYTTDGSEPTESSTRYMAPITIRLAEGQSSKNTTLKAKAFKAEYTPSDTATGDYRLWLPVVATPAFSPAPGNYSVPVSVTMSCATSDAVIHYTLDGTKPTKTSKLYRDPITITTPTTLKARAFKTDYVGSEIASGDYKVVLPTLSDKPIFAPDPGKYKGSVEVTISYPVNGSEIRYTTDGTEPTEKSPRYRTPLTFTSNGSTATSTTLNAKAFKDGYYPTGMTKGVYTLIPAKASTPTFDPAPGTFTSPVRITIFCSLTDAIIRYTLDGTEPTESSTRYLMPLTFKSTTTLKAKAFKDGFTPSNTATGVYTITTLPAVETPAFSPASGIYKDSVTVSISCATSGAVIHYTTDGSEPNKLSKVYSAPLTFNNSGSTVISTTLNAKAFKDDYTPSETARGVYIITPPTPVVETPTFTPAPGTYSLTVQIIMSCATSGAEIHYTTDGTEPTRASQTYSTPVRLMDTTTLKAKAFLTGYTPSETATGEYTITPLPVVETPTFTPAPGTYSLTVQVIISCATSGAEIHYTLDGTEPTQTSQTYSTPVRLINTRTLKARAFLAGYTPSETATGEYTITHVP